MGFTVLLSLASPGSIPAKAPAALERAAAIFPSSGAGQEEMEQGFPFQFRPFQSLFLHAVSDQWGVCDSLGVFQRHFGVLGVDGET